MLPSTNSIPCSDSLHRLRNWHEIKFIVKNYVLLKFSCHLLAALALIVVCSICLGQLLQASAAPFIMHMCRHQGGVAYLR